MGSRLSPGSKRNVVLYPLFHAPDFPDQVGQIATVFDEVDLRAVDHEQWSLRIMMKKGPEGFRQALQVLRGDAALEVAVPLADAAHQHVGPGLEIDDEIGTGNLRIEELEDLPVERQLVAAEGNAGEDAVLGKEVVRDRPARADAARTQLELLAIAFEGEEELCLEGMTFRIRVESLQKGVVFDSLQDEFGAEIGGQPPRQGRLADTDGTLDRDVPPHPSVLPHPLPA